MEGVSRTVRGNPEGKGCRSHPGVAVQMEWTPGFFGILTVTSALDSGSIDSHVVFKALATFLQTTSSSSRLPLRNLSLDVQPQPVV